MRDGQQTRRRLRHLCIRPGWSLWSLDLFIPFQKCGAGKEIGPLQSMCVCTAASGVHAVGGPVRARVGHRAESQVCGWTLLIQGKLEQTDQKVGPLGPAGPSLDPCNGTDGITVPLPWTDPEMRDRGTKTAHCMHSAHHPQIKREMRGDKSSASTKQHNALSQRTRGKKVPGERALSQGHDRLRVHRP